MNTAINVLKEEIQPTYDWLKPIGTLLNAGLYLVPIPPDKKTGKPLKGPVAVGWNHPKAKNNPKGYSNDIADFAGCKGFNFGLAHLPAKTIPLDIDSLSDCLTLFDDLGLPLREWLDDPNRVEIQSGKANRGKLLYRLPAGVDWCATQQLKANGDMIFELRNSSSKGTTLQDVIHGTHPDTGTQYKIIGDINNIPEIPEALLDIALHWDEWKPCFESALGIEQEIPKIANRAQQQGDNLAGKRSPIHEFNQANTTASILINNGYKPVGKNRFIRPGSSSKAPGIVILDDCKDSADRVYSFGGDVLNDGFGHDAFDCRRYLELGDTNPHQPSPKALGWSEEITEHNQSLWKQSNNAPQPSTRHDNVVPLGRNDKVEPVKPTFRLLSIKELAKNPKPISWTIKKVLEKGGMNVISGPYGSGKSFIAFDMAFCIASGLAWNGERVEQCPVVLIAGEGHSGITNRFIALSIKYGIEIPECLYLSEIAARFTDRDDAILVGNSVNEVCPDAGAVFVDTLSRNFGGGDENSTKDMGEFVYNLDAYFRNSGKTITVIHHTGHGDTTRGRGSIVLPSACEGEFLITKKGNNTVLECKKQKNAKIHDPMSFEPQVINLPGLFDEDGEQETSLIMNHTGNAVNSGKKIASVLNAREEAVLTSLSDAIVKHGVEPTPEIKQKFGEFNSFSGKHRKMVHFDHWRDFAYKSIVIDSKSGESKTDSKKKAFQVIRKKLDANKLIGMHDDYVWMLFDDQINQKGGMEL